MWSQHQLASDFTNERRSFKSKIFLLKMFDRLINREINAEILVTFMFIIISGFYIEAVYGFGKILDALFLWMFPASVMIFLTLILVKIIERFHSRTVGRYRYVDWRKSK